MRGTGEINVSWALRSDSHCPGSLNQAGTLENLSVWLSCVGGHFLRDLKSNTVMHMEECLKTYVIKMFVIKNSKYLKEKITKNGENLTNIIQN